MTWTIRCVRCDGDLGQPRDTDSPELCFPMVCTQQSMDVHEVESFPDSRFKYEYESGGAGSI